ncbi:putative nucleoredoxin-like 2 protein [Trypoxylus dichotomus]
MDDLFSLKYLLNCAGALTQKEGVLRYMDVIVYLFSSTECHPGNQLLPLLKKIYEVVKKRRMPMEIIYVPSDTDEDVMLKHFISEHHGWHAIRVKENAIMELHLRYNITHEPQIVVVSKDGEIVSRRGRADVLELGLNVLVKWLRPYII